MDISYLNLNDTQQKEDLEETIPNLKEKSKKLYVYFAIDNFKILILIIKQGN